MNKSLVYRKKFFCVTFHRLITVVGLFYFSKPVLIIWFVFYRILVNLCFKNPLCYSSMKTQMLKLSYIFFVNPTTNWNHKNGNMTKSYTTLTLHRVPNSQLRASFIQKDLAWQKWMYEVIFWPKKPHWSIRHATIEPDDHIARG